MKILIAEDDRLSRTFLEEFMKEYGTCDSAEDGMAALDYYLDSLNKGEPYDLLCLDIMMPKVDGIKLVKVIRTMEKQQGVAAEDRVRIIMMTALADVDYVDRAFALGCDAYASKPIDTARVEEVLRKLGLLKK